MSKTISQSNYKSISKQSGWTMWSLLFTLGIVFIFVYIGMNLVPIFSANESIKNAMKQSVEGQNLGTMTKRKIEFGMRSQLDLDSSEELIDYKSEIKVAKTRSQFILQADYEREIPLVANLYLIARFNPKLTCDLNGRCEPF